MGNYRKVGFEWTVSDGRLWHDGCGKEVLYIDGDYVCECGESSATADELEAFIANINAVGLITALIMNPDKIYEMIETLREMIGSNVAGIPEMVDSVRDTAGIPETETEGER